jgi:hypothetical protein
MELNMYGIKVWLSEDTKDWYLLRDMDDGVVHVWDKKEDVINIQKNLKCKKSAITKIMSNTILDRVNYKRKQLEHLKYFLK